MSDNNPVTRNGEVAPVAVKDPGFEVTVKPVAAGESPGNVKATSTAPLLKARPVPTLVAEVIVGCFGSKKSLACCDFLPALLPIAMFSP